MMDNTYLTAGKESSAFLANLLLPEGATDEPLALTRIHAHSDRVEIRILFRRRHSVDLVLESAVTNKPYLVRNKNIGIFYLGKTIPEPLVPLLQSGLLNFPDSLTVQDIREIIKEDPDTRRKTGRKIYTLSFYGNGTCNLDCRYCLSKENSTSQLFSEALFRAGIEFVLDLDNIYFISVDFGLGGEPSLFLEDYKKLYTLCKDYISKSGKEIKLGFLTNGRKLDAEALDWFEINNPWIGFSIDGDEATHNSMRVDREGTGSFRTTMDAAKRIFERGWDNPPGISATLTGKNPDVLANFLALWQLGFRVIITKPVRIQEDTEFAVNRKTLPAILDGYSGFGRFLEQSILAGKLEYIRAILNPIDYLGRFIIRFLNKESVTYRCGAGRSTFSIKNNGDVYPCDSFAGIEKEKIGNIYQPDFKDRAADKETIIPAVHEIEKCSSCRIATLCGGPCQYLLRINGSGDFETECRLNSHLIRVAYSVYRTILSIGNVHKELLKHITLQNDQYSDTTEYTTHITANQDFRRFLINNSDRYVYDESSETLILRGCMFHYEREALLVIFPAPEDKKTITELYRESQFHLYKDEDQPATGSDS